MDRSSSMKVGLFRVNQAVRLCELQLRRRKRVMQGNAVARWVKNPSVRILVYHVRRDALPHGGVVLIVLKSPLKEAVRSEGRIVYDRELRIHFTRGQAALAVEPDQSHGIVGLWRVVNGERQVQSVLWDGPDAFLGQKQERAESVYRVHHEMRQALSAVRAVCAQVGDEEVWDFVAVSAVQFHHASGGHSVLLEIVNVDQKVKRQFLFKR